MFSTSFMKEPPDTVGTAPVLSSAWKDQHSELSIRPAVADDLLALDAIRRAAFAPIFASFRALLGDALYELAQAKSDNAQGALLASMFSIDSGWELYTAIRSGKIAGFVSVKLDLETKMGEIGLNAVDPAFAGQGIGAAMYDFATTRMKEAGMLVAHVSTGGDSSHAAARRAYEKAGFDAHIPSVWFCRTL